LSNCWDLKGCPASHYINCVAYRKKTNCWEIREGCLCHAYDSCKQCPIFVKYEQEQRDYMEGKPQQ